MTQRGPRCQAKTPRLAQIPHLCANLLYGTSHANQAFKQDIFQISSRVEGGEHGDRLPIDAIQNVVGPDDEFPPNRQTVIGDVAKNDKLATQESRPTQLVVFGPLLQEPLVRGGPARQASPPWAVFPIACPRDSA
jgi:hypothetical protein